MNKQLKAFFIIYGIAIFWWITTIIYREIITKKDIQFLRKSVFCAPKPMSCSTYNCNGWCVGHFFNYLALGFFAPKYAPLAIFLGALFELLELVIERHTSSKFIDAKIMQDIFTNTMGTIVGYILSPYK